MSPLPHEFSTRTKVVMAYENVGPYHLARLRSISEHCDLLVVEFAENSAVYDWEVDRQFPFQCRTLSSSYQEATSKNLRGQIFDTLSEFAPDVVFVPGWSAHGAQLILLWCLLNKVPAVLMSDSQEIDERRVFFKEALKKQVVSNFAGAFVAGSRHKAYLRKLGFYKRPIEQHYDVVDNDHFRPSTSTDSRHYFMACARFVAKKNLQTLLEAYQILYVRSGAGGEAVPELYLVGDGPLRRDLYNKAVKLGIEHKVVMPGRVDYQRLPSLYHDAMAFVLPSTSEQWGLVVNEALAAGCPVLVSQNAGCAPELVKEGVNGFVFDPHDRRLLADHLEKLWKEDGMRHSFSASSLKIVENHTLRHHSSAVLKLSRSVLSQPYLGNRGVIRRLIAGMVLRGLIRLRKR